MRSVRCDACGTKALMAASQCPKCGHLFEVRDGSGDPLPLAHCPSCDAYYPAHVHSCKWCGTTLIPEKPRKGDGDRVRWIAGGTVAVAVILGLLAREPSSKRAPSPRSPNQSKVTAAVPTTDTLARATALPPIDTSPGDTASHVDPVLTDVSAPAASPSPSPSPAVVTPGRVTSATLPSERRRSSPWVSMVARKWVIVRTDAERRAHIVASVGPNARVQLGETRGSWRRIRSRGIAGWVDVSGGPFVAIPSARRHSTSHIASSLKR